MYIRKILSYSKIYNLFGSILRPGESGFHFFRDWVGETTGLRVLDLGCGTGSKLKCFDNIQSYVGIDISEKYISSAKETYKQRGECSFHCIDLNEFASQCNEKFDLITMIGVMHHISDDEVDAAMISIKRLLAPDGRFISYDGCYTSGMNLVAKLMLDFDRGNYVRREDEWLSLIGKHWQNIKYQVRTDSLRIPYSVIVFDCQMPST